MGNVLKFSRNAKIFLKNRHAGTLSIAIARTVTLDSRPGLPVRVFQFQIFCKHPENMMEPGLSGVYC